MRWFTLGILKWRGTFSPLEFVQEKLELKMQVPFLDLRVPPGAEREEFQVALANVLDHGRLILGPEVLELEKAVARETNQAYAVGTSSGTSALIIALKALGVGSGDEVITSPFSFVATANAILASGAVPVFADVGDDLNLSPEKIEPLITKRTKAIMPVHWTGKVCDMDSIISHGAV